MRVRRYVALGDSFTAGNGLPEDERWPDRLAAAIASAGPGLEYVNLGRDGADSAEVLARVERANELRPDLVTVTCGANDVLLSLRPDPESFGGRLELILDRLRAPNPRLALLLTTYPEGWSFAGFGPRTTARVSAAMAEVNRRIRSVAAERGAAVLEIAGHPDLARPGSFEPDGLHPSPPGHARAAEAAAEVLRRRYGIQSAPAVTGAERRTGG